MSGAQGAVAGKPAPRSSGIASPAGRFRREIDDALAKGAEATGLRLCLTRGDANRLLRDPEIAATDIRFEVGVMHFLGVQIQQGGVDASRLELIESEG